MALKKTLLMVCLLASPSLWATTFVYVSNATSGSISRYQLDSASGALTPGGTTVVGGKIMPLAVSPDKQFLYGAVRSKPWSIISWSINGKNGDLQQRASAAVDASYPWITTDKSGRYLLAASYDSDVVVSQRIEHGLVTDRVSGRYKTGPHAHSVVVDNSNRSLYVGNLGNDRVLQLTLGADGTISEIGKGYVSDEKESGPRHSVMSPDNRFLYNLTEMGGTITQYRRQPDGALEKLHSWPNAVAARYQLAHGRQRPADYSDPTPRIWAADLKMTPDGRFLYMSERTSSTVSGYRVDAQNGVLTLIGSWPVEKQPRGMAIDGSGKWLLVSGEKSAVVGSYAINDKDGTLARVAEAPCGAGANWVVTVTR